MWSSARRASRRLEGLERANLAGVLRNTESLARRHMLAARLVPVFMTIARNYEWFWRDRRHASFFGDRRTFAGAPVIFQFYPGSGWQLQPLGNFGRLAALARFRRSDPAELAAYADALLALAVQRKRFSALEYYFPWGGGEPGWISGMATATALSALARVYVRTGDDRYRDAAARMLPAFFTRPPWGILLERPHGAAHYLQYSQAPDVLIGNAFAQALIGLDDYARIAHDERARAALARGLIQADTGMARYDTGAWSLYWRPPGSRRGAESDLHYHELFRDFLTTLCRRFPARSFCALRDRFARYEREPVRIGRLRVGRHGGRLTVRVWVSKRGSATLTLLRGDATVRRRPVALTRGTQVVRWPLPRHGRRFRLRLEAVSLTGLRSAASRSVELSPRRRSA